MGLPNALSDLGDCVAVVFHTDSCRMGNFHVRKIALLLAKKVKGALSANAQQASCEAGLNFGGASALTSMKTDGC